MKSAVLAVLLCGLLCPVPAQSPDPETTATSTSEAERPDPGKVSIAVSGAPLSQVAAQVSRSAGIELTPRGSSQQQRVSVVVRNRPLTEVMDLLAAQLPGGGMIRKFPDRENAYELWDRESYNREVLPTMVRQKVFIPREITAEDAFKAVQGTLTPGIGTATFDPRSNKLFVTDLPEVLALVQSLVAHIDVGFVTRVFYVQRTDVEVIAEKLSQLRSPAAPELELDVRNHQIIARDRLESIRKMELLLSTLDQPRRQVWRSYDEGNAGAAQQVPSPAGARRGRKL